MQTRPRRTDCAKCPLAGLHRFRKFNETELAFVSEFKTGELEVDPGATVMVEKSNSAHLYTILAGWAFRYKTMEDGRRQILNYALPGDLIGLQGSLMGEMQHSVEALTAVKLCVFERNRLAEVFRNHPTLAYDITWLAAREERILDENLLSIGRRSALERAAYLLAFLFERASSVGMADGGKLAVPITQQHIADTLGLSIVHTNKTLRKLTERGYVRWRGRTCEIVDRKGLLSVADWDGLQDTQRPFI